MRLSGNRSYLKYLRPALQPASSLADLSAIELQEADGNSLQSVMLSRTAYLAQLAFAKYAPLPIPVRVQVPLEALASRHVFVSLYVLARDRLRSVHFFGLGRGLDRHSSIPCTVINETF